VSDFSYTLPEPDIKPLTPEQLAAIDPELLRDLPVLAPEPARFLGPNEMAEPPDPDPEPDQDPDPTPTKTPAEILAEQNRPSIAAIESRAREIGGRVSGKPQDYIDELVAGAASGKYSAADVNAALTGLAAQYPETDSGGEEKEEDSELAALRKRLAELEAAKDNESARRKNDARSTIAKVLKTYGLESLSEYLYGIIASDEINLNNPDAIIFSIRERPEYQTRFAANKARIGKGLPELDPGTYVALEEQYRATLQANGMPKDFYDKSDDFTAWIEGDVSPAEIQSRIVEGFRAVDDADPEVKRQMTRLYRVNQADLAAYFLDPKRAEPILKTKQLIRQAQAAQVAARAKEQGFMDIAAATAEEIVSRGITAQQAQEGFGRMTELAGLYTEMGTEEALSETEKIGAALGFDEAATRKLQTRVATRKAAFQGGGGFTSTRGATSGTTETGLGGPQ
jgi:hypothetical protein